MFRVRIATTPRYIKETGKKKQVEGPCGLVACGVDNGCQQHK